MYVYSDRRNRLIAKKNNFILPLVGGFVFWVSYLSMKSNDLQGIMIGGIMMAVAALLVLSFSLEELVIDPADRTVYWRRQWIILHAVKQLSFDDITAVRVFEDGSTMTHILYSLSLVMRNDGELKIDTSFGTHHHGEMIAEKLGIPLQVG